MANTTKNLLQRPYGRAGRIIHSPVDGGSHLYEGALVAQLTATGMLCPMNTAGSGPAVGISTQDADNTSGADGAVRCVVETDRVYEFDNASGGDACSEATRLFSFVWAYDDHTAADNDAAGTRQIAGRFMGMSEDGRVRVLVGPDSFEELAHIRTSKAHVLFALGDAREVDSSGDHGNIVANGGLLASDTTPIMRANANEANEISWATGNADIISFDCALPQDFDGTSDATLDLLVASGSTDAATFTVNTSWDQGAQVTDTASDAGTLSATAHVITATIAAADIPDSPTCVTVQLVPPAHATNTIQLGAVRLNYKRKLLAS